MDCLAAPQIKCPDGYKPMATGDLVSYADTPDGKEVVAFVTGLLVVFMVGDTSFIDRSEH